MGSILQKSKDIEATQTLFAIDLPDVRGFVGH